jgi:phosphosulfolactate synthase (CoM biosynthesis protein A)
MVLIMFVQLDFKRRYDKMATKELKMKQHHVQGVNDMDDIDYFEAKLHSPNKTHKSENNTVIVQRSFTGKTELTHSTHGWDVVSALAMTKNLDSRPTIYSTPARSVQKFFIVEFAPGLNPPLGRPEHGIG